MADWDGITRIDLTESDTLEVKILKEKSGRYKLWVNGPKGMLMRAYNIVHMVVDLDADVLAEAIKEHKESNP